MRSLFSELIVSCLILVLCMKNVHTLGSRKCYDCVYQRNTKSWGPCEGPIKTQNYVIVDAPLCQRNCFVKIDKKGDIRRGCYDGTYGIDDTLLGCHVQGPHDDLYCFCSSEECNGGAPEDYQNKGNFSMSIDQFQPLETNKDLTKTYRKEDSTFEIYPKEPEFGEKTLHKTDIAEVKQVDARRSRTDVSRPSRTDLSRPFPKFLPPRVQSLNPGGFLYDRARTGEDNSAHKNRQRTDKKNISFDVVYGVDTQPKVYSSPHLDKPISAIASQRNHEHRKIDDFEHSVDVQTKKEKKGHSSDVDIHKNVAGDLDISQEENDGINREFVDHIQRQRELKTTHHVGNNLDSLAHILPGTHLSDPEVEHKKTQHFHKYNVGERTIEHHIVEHYVLHHRIKELLKDIQGVNAKNIDPRQASIIYRLLHPEKVAQLDAQDA